MPWGFWIGCVLLLALVGACLLDGLKEGKREDAILTDLLFHAWAHGLDLVKRSNGLLRRGTVYVTLGRLEQEGLIESLEEAVEPGHEGTPRRVYTLTAAGREEALSRVAGKEAA